MNGADLDKLAYTGYTEAEKDYWCCQVGASSGMVQFAAKIDKNQAAGV